MKRKTGRMLAAWLCVCLVALAGCGGGGGGSDYEIAGDDGAAGDVDFQTLQLGTVIDGTFSPGLIGIDLPDGEPLAYLDTADLTVAVADGDGDRYTEPVPVTFSSDFQRTGQADLTGTATTVDGSATAVYTAQGGAGEDTITASTVVGQKTLTATATLTVAGPEPAALEFVSATPNILALKGTGGSDRPEISWLTYRAVNAESDPLPGIAVDFALETVTGALINTFTGTTDDSGLVEVYVTSGENAASLRVRATISGTEISTLSEPVIVSTALPDQNNFSLLAADGGFDSTSGYRYTITAHAFDHFNHPVPDDTVIAFSAEEGQIQNRCFTTDGMCSVTWQHTSPPVGVTILATALGEESFVDVNEDGAFSGADARQWQPETFDLPLEPFRDDNQNGVFEPGTESFRDYNANGAFDPIMNGIYNGVLCSGEAEGQDLCTRDLLPIRADVVLGEDAILSEARLGAMIDGVFVDGRLALGVEEGEQLASLGTTTVTATVVDENGDPIQIPLDIQFSSGFVSENKARMDNVVTTADGTATAVYKAEGGAGPDTITATVTVADNTLTAQTTINVAASPAGSIQFVSVEPERLALSGTASLTLPETAAVTFKVLDDFGNALPNQTVDFELSTAVGGLEITPQSAVSNSAGEVVTYVQSGHVATSVRVKATVRNTAIATQSEPLIVSTGLPDQNSFSLNAAPLNPEAWDYDGVVVEIGVIASDHFNNPVPDGTAIYFTTEGGQIEDSCFTTGGSGSCTVKWTSSAPRPADGRTTILATTIGEESFIDVDGNGVFTAEDDRFWPIAFDIESEAYRNDNDTVIPAIFDYGSEEFVDFDRDGEFDEYLEEVYNGTLCSDTAESAGVCSKNLLNVRAELVLVMSGSSADIQIQPAEIDLTTANGVPSQTVTITLTDERGQVMPSGTSVSVTTTNGVLVGKTAFTVPSSTSTDPESPAIQFKVRIDRETEPNDKSVGALQVNVTTPENIESSEFATVRDDG